MIPARVRLAPSTPFEPAPQRIHRVTLGWWEGTEPVLVASPTGAARTVVVVWPADARGYVDVPAVRAGRVEVTTWDLSPRELAELRTLAEEGWPLDRHDLYVTTAWVGPALRSLRHTDFWSVAQASVEAAIRAVSG